jgi:oxygen-independent coproporphyrinogen-3 oxidase
VEALCHEMDLRHDYLDHQPADTLYIGGGTPTVLSPDLLEKIIRHAKTVFGLKSQSEITLEANPNNLNEEYIKRLSDSSVNRLSIGIQSFYDDNLLTLGRIHTGRQAETCLELAYKYGFGNMSIDLMYAYPLLTAQRWRENLEKVKTVDHLSCYSLSLESGSKLYKQIQNKVYSLPDEDEVIEQYHILTDFARENNFIHYETSNFCKQGQFSKHNTAYWQDEIYIGIGPSAHSFNRTKRLWNVADLNGYIRQIMTIHTHRQWELMEEDLLFSSETLTPTMRVNEYMMTSLRTIWGCNLQYVKEQFGTSFYAKLIEKIETINRQWYIIESDKLILTPQGSLLADAIARDLFFD